MTGDIAIRSSASRCEGTDPPTTTSIRPLKRQSMAPLPGGLPSAPGVLYDRLRHEDFLIETEEAA